MGLAVPVPAIRIEAVNLYMNGMTQPGVGGRAAAAQHAGMSLVRGHGPVDGDWQVGHATAFGRPGCEPRPDDEPVGRRIAGGYPERERVVLRLPVSGIGGDDRAGEDRRQAEQAAPPCQRVEGGIAGGAGRRLHAQVRILWV